MRIIPPELPTKLVAASFTALLLLASPSPTSAQEIGTENTSPSQQSSPTASESATPIISPTQTSTITTLETRDISGEVVKATDDNITVKTDKETVQLRVFDNIKITRDGKEVKPQDIKPGDQVKATIDSNSNQAITLAATSRQALDLQQWLPLIIIGALVLLGLLFWLFKKMSQQRIKTTTTNM